MNNYNQHLGMHAGAKPELFRFAEELRNQMTEPENKLWDDRSASWWKREPNDKDTRLVLTSRPSVIVSSVF